MDEKNPNRQSNDQEQQVRNKENNPFSEQEKHGDEAQRRAPGSAEEYQVIPQCSAVLPRGGDTEEEERKEERSCALLVDKREATRWRQGGPFRIVILDGKTNARWCTGEDA